MIKKAREIEAVDDQWDNGELGRSLDHAVVIEDEHEKLIDAALHLQPISIRLEKSLIDAFKFITSHHKGIGYQPLMRQVLHRFAAAEIKRIAAEMDKEVKQEKSIGSEDVADAPLKKSA